MWGKHLPLGFANCLKTLVIFYLNVQYVFILMQHLGSLWCVLLLATRSHIAEGSDVVCAAFFSEAGKLVTVWLSDASFLSFVVSSVPQDLDRPGGNVSQVSPQSRSFIGCRKETSGLQEETGYFLPGCFPLLCLISLSPSSSCDHWCSYASSPWYQESILTAAIEPVRGFFSVRIKFRMALPIRNATKYI